MTPRRRDATLFRESRMTSRWWLCLQVYAALAVLCCNVSAAIEPTGVVVLYNDSSQDSIDIANYYAQAHPGVRLLGLSNVSTSEEVTQDHYLDVIRPQVLAGID